MGSILSIDYGLKRIGLAISDSSRSFAFPLSVLENKGFIYVLESIKNLIIEREIDLILIGIPYNSKQETKKTSMQSIVEEFIDKIQEKITIPIVKVDERFSSFMAEENLKDAGINTKKSKKFIDLEAARLLLEEYLKENVS